MGTNWVEKTLPPSTRPKIHDPRVDWHMKQRAVGVAEVMKICKEYFSGYLARLPGGFVISRRGTLEGVMSSDGQNLTSPHLLYDLALARKEIEHLKNEFELRHTTYTDFLDSPEMVNTEYAEYVKELGLERIPESYRDKDWSTTRAGSIAQASLEQNSF